MSDKFQPTIDADITLVTKLAQLLPACEHAGANLAVSVPQNSSNSSHSADGVLAMNVFKLYHTADCSVFDVLAYVLFLFLFHHVSSLNSMVMLSCTLLPFHFLFSMVSPPLCFSLVSICTCSYVVSGRVHKGAAVKVLGEAYTLVDEEDCATAVVQGISVPCGRYKVWCFSL